MLQLYTIIFVAFIDYNIFNLVLNISKQRLQIYTSYYNIHAFDTFSFGPYKTDIYEQQYQVKIPLYFVYS